MKNRIITALAVVGVLTTGAYAYGGFGNCDGSGKGMRNQQGMQPQAQNRGWGGNKMNKKRNRYDDGESWRNANVFTIKSNKRPTIPIINFKR